MVSSERRKRAVDKYNECFRELNSLINRCLDHSRSALQILDTSPQRVLIDQSIVYNLHY